MYVTPFPRLNAPFGARCFLTRREMDRIMRDIEAS